MGNPSSDSETESVPVHVNGQQRYMVPEMLPAYSVAPSPTDEKCIVITLYNKLELPTRELSKCGRGDEMVGSVRQNNYFQYKLNGTENPHRTARVITRLREAREEQLPLIEEHTEFGLAGDGSHMIAAFSCYLNDIRMFPFLVDEKKMPVWVDMFEFDKNGDENDPEFIIDPVEIFGRWWHEEGRHIAINPPIPDLEPIPDDAPVPQDKSATTVVIGEDGFDSQQSVVVEEVEEEQRADQEQVSPVDDDEEELDAELKRKFSFIPTWVLRTLPDRLMVDSMTYAFMRSKNVRAVEAVPVIGRPWAIGHVNVTIPRKGFSSFIRSIRKHEPRFRSELQVNVDMLHARLQEVSWSFDAEESPR